MEKRKKTVLKGILVTLFGAFCAFRSNWFVTTFSILTILYGVVILVAGCSKAQFAVVIELVVPEFIACVQLLLEKIPAALMNLSAWRRDMNIVS